MKLFFSRAILDFRSSFKNIWTLRNFLSLIKSASWRSPAAISWIWSVWLCRSRSLSATSFFLPVSSSIQESFCFLSSFSSPNSSWASLTPKALSLYISVKLYCLASVIFKFFYKFFTYLLNSFFFSWLWILSFFIRSKICS